MSDSLTRMVLTPIFCDVDNFYTTFEQVSHDTFLQLPHSDTDTPNPYRSRLSISEVMTIVIAFHGSRFRTFKDFYTLQVLPHWTGAFPNLVSYTRFVELNPWSIIPL